MTLTFDQGHDGEGYDLGALGRCGDDEKKDAARVLADKLLTGGGGATLTLWRLSAPLRVRERDFFGSTLYTLHIAFLELVLQAKADPDASFQAQPKMIAPPRRRARLRKTTSTLAG